MYKGTRSHGVTQVLPLLANTTLSYNSLYIIWMYKNLVLHRRLIHRYLRTSGRNVMFGVVVNLQRSMVLVRISEFPCVDTRLQDKKTALR